MAVKNNKSSSDKALGQIFTPSYIAEFMVKNVVGVLEDQSNDYNNSLKLEKLKILEPASGRGIFLKALLENNFRDITAYEIDESLKEYLESTYPEIKFEFQDFLSSNSEEIYDLIIGNPPYLGQNYNSSLFQELVQKYDICKKYFVGNMDLFYYFIHLGIEKLKPGGLLSFITTNYWITKSKKTGIKYLKPHITKECFIVQYIDLSKISVFKDAKGQHNCIFILQKKSENEKRNNIDKKIEVIQIRPRKIQVNENSNQEIFTHILSKEINSNILRYSSAITNKDLSKDNGWILKYPIEVKNVVNKIEKYCRFDGKLSHLTDFFIIRNGLILIKDEIFILRENEHLKIIDKDVFIKIKERFVKLSDEEKTKLKKIFKSKVIKPFSYDKSDFLGFLIYFDKNEFKNRNLTTRNEQIERKYPNLTAYLNQYKRELVNILRNAKENIKDIYFPRRGSLITQYDNENKRKLIHLEPYYDKGSKIFFSYITNSNVFGYTRDPYYATSDTYFLWLRKGRNNIDYLFILAYLNSKIMKFLFKAKNITIKRSKTKLEEEIPIPNILLFQSPYQLELVNLVRYITSKLTQNIMFTDESILYKLKQLSPNTYSQIRNVKNFKRIIDICLLKLFDLDEENINLLIEKYY